MRLFWKPLGVALGISLLLHVLGGFLFRASAVTDTPPTPKPPLVTFLSPTADSPSFRTAREAIALADPSASSLPNPRGFSSTAIARTNAVRSELDLRKINPQLLPLPTSDLSTRTLVHETALPALLAAYVSKQPPLAIEEADVTVPLTLSPTGSGFELGGTISNRPLMTLPSIPPVRHPAPLQPSVIRIAVSPLGDVKFAILERSCGMEDKDARGLDIARRWRFQSVPDATGDQWGFVWIYWVAERAAAPASVAETNAPAAAGTTAPGTPAP